MPWDFSSIGVSDSDKPRVLLVDDEAAFAMLRYNLETHGFPVEHAANGQEALSRIEDIRPHVVLLDWTLPVAKVSPTLSAQSAGGYAFNIE